VRRDPFVKALFLFILALLGLFAWMTRHPESPLLDRAERWPALRPLVSAFRASYLGREPTELGREPLPEEQLRDGWAIGDYVPSDVPTTVWVNEGTEMRARPEPEAPVVATISAISRLPNLRRNGDWFLVLYREDRGWVYLERYGEEGRPPLGSEPSPPKPLPGLSPDPELLRLARSHLSSAQSDSVLGEYALITDSEDEELRRTLAHLATRIEEVYQERYGVVPIDKPREGIVLFARESAYRAFQERLERLSGLPAAGLMSRGIVAMYTEGRDRGQVAATLVHEIAHTLNRRAIGPALPPWIDEGIADDLAYSVGPDGELRPGELGGLVRREEATQILMGGRAAAVRLREAIDGGQGHSLREILDLGWEEFVVEDDLGLNYAHSAFWVRYLLSGWRPDLVEGFREYLRGIAAGQPATSDALADHLGRDWSELDRDFSAWTRLGFPGRTAVGSVFSE
jgi:hypothetical protein